MAEEELLLEEDRGQRTSVPDTPAPQPDDAEEIAPVLSKLQAAGSIKIEAGTSSQEAKVYNVPSKNKKLQ
jgi:sRNA-binding protein